MEVERILRDEIRGWLGTPPSGRALPATAEELAAVLTESLEAATPGEMVRMVEMLRGFVAAIEDGMKNTQGESPATKENEDVDGNRG